MNVTREQIYQIYKMSYSISESRGKARQKKINDTIIEICKSNPLYDGCEFKTEVRLAKNISSGKWFSVDVLVYKSNKLVELILAKAPASNIVQNSVNMSNARFREVGRLFKYIEDGVKLTFINFQPNITPFFKQNGAIKSFEKNSTHTLNLFKGALNSNLTFSEIFITFNIEGVEDCKTKDDVKSLLTNSEVISNIFVEVYE